MKFLATRWVMSGAILTCASSGWAASFQGLGDLGGSISRARGVSGDGLVVVGGSRTATGFDESFFWTAQSGIVSIGDLPGSVAFGRARGVNDDGSVIVGDGISNQGQEAFRWTPAQGMIGLGDLPGGSTRSVAHGVSGDGSVVVGESASDGATQAFRWTPTGGISGLGFLAGTNTDSIANAASFDGSVVVGFANADGDFQAFRWTQATGMVGLGASADGQTLSVSATDVTPDGSVVVGQGGRLLAGPEAFRWTADEGVVGLGFLPGSLSSQANAVSADGSVVVGETPGSILQAIIWDEDQGMRRLRDVLSDDHNLGFDMIGWVLQSAADISDDGRVIVGHGINPSGQTEGWVAVLGARWSSNSGGTWDNAGNWGGDVPRPGEDVLINPMIGVTVQGPSSFRSVGDLIIGARGQGVAVLELSTGTIRADGEVVIESAGQLGGTGTLNALSGVVNHGQIALGPGGQLVGGLLTNHGLIRGGGQISSELLNAADGELRAFLGRSITLIGENNANEGQISLLGGSIEVIGTLENRAGAEIIGRGTLIFNQGLTNQGNVTFSSGVSDVIGPVNLDGGSMVLTGSGSVTFFDEFIHNGSDFRVTAGSTAVFLDDLSGSGSFTGGGTIQIEGGFNPGSSPDIITFGGDLVLQPSSVTTMEIGGTIPGLQHDQLIIAGLLSLDGTLVIEFIDQYPPTLGDTFELFRAGSIQGMFTQLVLPNLEGGLSFDIESFLSTGELALVPEPTMWMIISWTIPAWLCGRTRRRRLNYCQ